MKFGTNGDSFKYLEVVRPLPQALLLWVCMLLTFDPPVRAEPGALPTPEEVARLPADGGPHFNRLVFELSPYLLQHARNPVDWYPWGDAAFERARLENKPVFLSVGYATCHWCHVMEHESFEDAEVAALLNKHFVCIKVDREERPDIDHLYMNFTQLMTGSGGWPMTVVMTPERQPFFAGTYFPKNGDRHRPGMLELLPHLTELWQDEHAKVLLATHRILATVRERTQTHAGDEWSPEVCDKAFRSLQNGFDVEHGGFGSAPKFPMPHQLLFLLRYARRTGQVEARDMALHTLKKMRLGGMYDHIGYGFHRYSTDRFWHLPHFEKMLYDQALLATACLEAYQLSGERWCLQMAEEILTYVLRDLQLPEKAFASAEDADSAGEEGLFYVWSHVELLNILGKDDGTWFAGLCGAKGEGNFADQATGHTTGNNIVYLQDFIKDSERSRFESCRERLFNVRSGRIRPPLDDKILTDWNGLMISALAHAHQVTGHKKYLQAAGQCASFIFKHLLTEEGHLLKRYRAGKAGGVSHLEDYAFVIQACLDLYASDYDPAHLSLAVKLQETLDREFWDGENGGYYLGADTDELLIRGKEIYDGAIPAGNSVAALNLVRLWKLTSQTAFLKRAQTLYRTFSGQVASQPSQHSYLMLALEWFFSDGPEIVIAAGQNTDSAQQMLALIREANLSAATVIFKSGKASEKLLEELLPFARDQIALDGKTTAYVCKSFTCQAPVHDLKGLSQLLRPPMTKSKLVPE